MTTPTSNLDLTSPADVAAELRQIEALFERLSYHRHALLAAASHLDWLAHINRMGVSAKDVPGVGRVIVDEMKQVETPAAPTSQVTMLDAPDHLTSGEASAWATGYNKAIRNQSKYQRAIWFLQDIAALAGTTKRKQAGCEIAAHALAQLGEPHSSEKTSTP